MTSHFMDNWIPRFFLLILGKVSLHQLSEEELYKKRICELHFGASDFVCRAGVRTRFNLTAVPKLYNSTDIMEMIETTPRYIAPRGTLFEELKNCWDETYHKCPEGNQTITWKNTTEK